MKKIVAAAAVSILSLLASGAARADVTLLFWPGPESEAMQKVIDSFNNGPGKTEGFVVKQLLFSRQGSQEKEMTDLSAGSSEFDLALVNSYSLGQFSPFLEPLDDKVPADALKIFSPSVLDSLKVGGHIYAVPTDISAHFTYYRKDLIDELLKNADWQKQYAAIAQDKLGKALSPKQPADWTWDDYVATSLFFTKSLNPKSPTRYGTALQLKNLLYNIMLWDDLLVSNGGDWFDKSGKPTLDSDAGRKALAIYGTIYKDGATPQGSTNYEFPEVNQAFGNGQAATMLQWNAAYSIVNDPKQMPASAGKVGIAPMPAGPAGHKTHIHATAIGMNKASQHKDQAVKFLAFLSTEGAMQTYADAGGIPPVPAVLNAMAAQHPEYVLLGQTVTNDGYVISGGTAATAMPIYQMLAQQLSGAWAGVTPDADALKAGQDGMAKIVGK